MENRLINYSENIFAAIIIIIACCGCVIVWLCGCAVLRSRGSMVWFLWLPLSFFGFRFLHIGTYRLLPEREGRGKERRKETVTCSWELYQEPVKMTVTIDPLRNPDTLRHKETLDYLASKTLP